MRRFLLSLLACLSVLTSTADDLKTVRGEYWIDSQYDNRTTVNVSNGEMNFAVNASGLTEGVHRLQVRAIDSEGNASPVLSWTFYRMAAATDAGTNTLEYWVDDGTHLTQNIGSDGTATFTFDGSKLTEGLHTLSYYVKNSAGYDSPTQRWLFYRERLATDLATSVQQYEYWIDDLYNNRATGNVTGNEVEFSVSAASLTEGPHTLNYRVRNDKGNYSPTQSWVFFRTAPEQVAGTMTVEYWIDEGSHLSQELTSADGAQFSIDCSTLAEGVHTLYYRLSSTNGTASPMQAWKFYCTKHLSGAVEVTWYRTWWNERQELAQKGTVISDSIVYELDRQFAVPVYAGYFCNENGDKANFNIQFGNESGFTTEVKSGEVTRTGVEFYAVGSAFAPTANHKMQATTNVELTFGNDLGWKHSQLTTLGIRKNSVSGSQAPVNMSGDCYDVETRKIPENGTYYVFKPSVDGSLRAGFTIDAGQPFYVVDGKTGTPVIDFDLQDVNGNVVQLQGTKNQFCSLARDLTGVCTIHVKGGTPYYIFTTDSPLRFYGYEFQKGDVDINHRTTEAIKDSIEAALSVTPFFTLNADRSSLTISCKTKEAVIYYTTDGSNPRIVSSQLYSKPLTLSKNCKVKAISVIDGTPSAVSEYAVDWFQVEKPTFSITGTTLTIDCPTEGADIYYSIGETVVPTRESTLYTGPFSLNSNQPVKAIAVKDDFNDSDIAVFDEEVVTSLGVDIAYNGRYVTLTPEEATATVYYTIDGTEPTANSEVYTEPFTISKLLTVKAAAMRPFTKMSEVSEVEITYLYDGENAFVKSSGLLSEAFVWCGLDAVEELHVNGPIDETDYSTLRGLPNLKVLNLVNSPITSLSFGALQGANMRWFVSPRLRSIGDDALADCRHLAAITWNGTAKLTMDVFGTHCNPNMLFYVTSESLVGIEGANIISNGRSLNITLKDGTEYCDFFCPTSFLAENISYSRDFKMKTKVGVCQGWETLALPFDVQTITHEKNGELVPYDAMEPDDDRKPFWLAELLNFDGFYSAYEILAYTPYIISMPNDSSAYANRYLQGGKVTFSAKSTVVGATDFEIDQGSIGDVEFVPNYELRYPDPNIFAINLYERYDATHAEGSIFLPNYRILRPFEAYSRSVYSARKFISIEELSGSEPTAIQEFKVQRIDDDALYNLQGLRVKTHGKGVYIKNGKKIMMK